MVGGRTGGGGGGIEVSITGTSYRKTDQSPILSDRPM